MILVQVAEIFTKIGAPSTTYQGLEELYEFLAANPTVPMEQLMSETSDGFKRYIRKGLTKVRAQLLTPTSAWLGLRSRLYLSILQLDVQRKCKHMLHCTLS
jgi:hypothetical protein